MDEKWVKAALLGTDRGDPSADLYAGTPPGLSEEDRFLGALACEWLAGKGAGRLNAEGTKLMPPVRAEASGLSFQLGSVVAEILEGDFAPALGECLHLWWESSKRMPPFLLPALFDRAVQDERLHPLFFDGLSPEEAWLAGLHPSWRILAPDPERPWADRSSQEQTHLLRYLRHKRNGEQAEALYTEKAPQSDWKNRKSWLRAWEYDLRPEDLPFLEAQLTDSRKEIRQAAAELVLKLPGSSLGQRLVQSLNELGFPFALSKPDNNRVFRGEPWHALGLFATSGKSLLIELAGRLHPTAWLELSQETDFGKVIEKLSRTPQRESLLRGLLQALSYRAHAPWAAQAFDQLAKSDPNDWLDWPESAAFLGVVPEARVHVFLHTELRRNEGWIVEKSLADRLLDLGVHRLDDSSAILIVRHFQKMLQSSSALDWRTWHYRRILRQCAYHCMPSVLRKLQQGWSHTPDSWQRDVDHFLRILDFRRRMHESFTS